MELPKLITVSCVLYIKQTILLCWENIIVGNQIFKPSDFERKFNNPRIIYLQVIL